MNRTFRWLRHPLGRRIVLIAAIVIALAASALADVEAFGQIEVTRGA